MKFLVLAAATFVSMSASAALDYSGNYFGKLNGDVTMIEVSRAGDTLTAHLEHMADDSTMLGSCGASIGEMISMDVDSDDGVTTIDSAEFKFNPGSCRQIIGRTITLDFKHKGGSVVGLNASIVYSATDVPGSCIPTYPNGQWCSPDKIRYDYLEGAFKK